MARTVWLHGLVALGACLVGGCLFHRPGELPPLQPATGESPSAAVVSVAPAPTTPPSYPLPPQSPYHPMEQRTANSVSPIEQVKLEMIAGPETPEPPKKMKEPVADPPVPTPAPEARLVAALRCALEKHPDEARHLLDKYDTPDRELILSLIRLLAGFDSQQIEKLSAEELSKTLEQLGYLSRELRPRAPLQLDKMHFCKKIEGFGQYEPLAADHKFSQGSDGKPGERVQVYVEVRNFLSAIKQDRHETQLRSSLEILDEDRRPVAKMTPETTTDISQTPRQDYFLNFQFHVPANLMPGLYTLWVTITDVTPSGQSKTVRMARRSLDFRVGPPTPTR